MRALRFSAIGFASVLLSTFAWWVAAPSGAAAATTTNLHELCRQVKNDDTIRPYSHDLYDGTAKAFKKLFPDAKAAPQESELQAQASYRCMNGKVLVCFVGATCLAPG